MARIAGEGRRGRVYDCFMFFNELLVLEVRLAELYEHVNRFVLVEATKTHSGEPKPLYYAENAERFAAWSDKITHVVVDDFPPPGDDAWVYENFQRRAVSRGLLDCEPEDLVIVSDADEIPRPSSLRAFRGPIAAVENRFYFYKFNIQRVEGNDRFLSSRLVRFRDFRDAQLLRNLNPPRMVVRHPWTRLLRRQKLQIIPDGGWHFSYLHEPEQIAQKIRSFAHQEFNTPAYKDEAEIERRIRSRHDLFGRAGHTWKVAPIDDSFPAYVRENQAALSGWIEPWEAAT